MSFRSVSTLLLLLFFLTGCAGITPEGNLRDEREEGPEAGLFSGPDGEFVIVGPAVSSAEKDDTDRAETSE